MIEQYRGTQPTGGSAKILRKKGVSGYANAYHCRHYCTRICSHYGTTYSSDEEDESVRTVVVRVKPGWCNCTRPHYLWPRGTRSGKSVRRREDFLLSEVHISLWRSLL